MVKPILSRNSAVKQYVQTSRGLFPHKRIVRKSHMSSKGLVVTEEQEDIAGPSSPAECAPSGASTKSDETNSRKSPIAELLYLRWLDGLKLKWPSLTS